MISRERRYVAQQNDYGFVRRNNMTEYEPIRQFVGASVTGRCFKWMVACTVVHSPPNNSRWQELSLYFLAQDCFTRYMEAPQSREFVYALVQREVNGEQLPVKTVSFGLVSSAAHRALILFCPCLQITYLWLDLGSFFSHNGRLLQ